MNCGYWESCGVRRGAILGNSGCGPYLKGDFLIPWDKPISSGRTKTSAYVDENRKSDSGFSVKGSQESPESNASSPTVQLQIIRMRLAVTAYRKLNFRAMDTSRAFPMSGPLKRDAYLKLPVGVEKDNAARALLKPPYGLSAACKDWYDAVRDFWKMGVGERSLPSISRYSSGSTMVWIWLWEGVPLPKFINTR